jgi:23S rRNA (adenine2503-C2)-methyltransferase
MQSLEMPSIEKCFISSDGTKRYLLRLSDGERVESVLIPRHDRATLCISSQVGCGLACKFCLTGQLGFTRDLTASEILAQIEIMLQDTTQRYSIVFMGMGEPLQNYENVMAAIHFLHDDHGLRLPMSRITVSTAGLIPAMERLASETLFPNLSISLTGITNKIRDVLMPINRKYPIESIMSAVRALPLPRQKRVMFECVMIHGLTDSIDDAERLSRLVQGMRAKINLIPLNPAEEIPFERADTNDVLRFQDVLLRNGITAFIRKNRGNDVFGACGQLQNSMAENPL